MIQINPKGGLGNMLFQIAAGYALAYKLGTDWAVLTPQSNIHGDMYNKYKSNILSKIPFINTGYKHPIYNEPSFEYSPLPLEKNITLDGFFQSEKYFSHYKNLILDLFLQDCSYLNEAKSQIGLYNTSSTVSLHIRRGDYLKYPNHHPQPPIEYYNRSLNLFPNHNILVFSDDINWCKENLNRNNLFYIENNPDVVDLYLMSLCDNNIITNSTFSWWGAWLNKNSNKIITVPNIWFGSSIKHSSKDLIPNSWKIL
jgi:hypothetical protein